MTTKIKHLAIVSENYAIEEKFYQAVFGMRTAERARIESASVVSDGYVGININPRRPGRQGGFDHFGFEVDDVEAVAARMREKYPEVHILKRPSNRPFAGLSTHDPAGNVFDLSQEGMENRADVYVDGAREADRRVKHFVLRAVEPERVARFYREVFDLLEMEKPADDPNAYFTDGRVTLVISPWKISDYAGTGIERPALDHIGFKVESVQAVKDRLEELSRRNPYLSPSPVGVGPEAEARLALFAKCKLGEYHLADPDGVMIAISEH
jgi:catechol 2,3-dioxygenase-like lactoylglutathione lyase family enzyme